MKKNKYLQIDLFMLTVITCLLEAVNILALKRFFPGSIFTLSIIIPMSVLVMIRWRAFAAVTLGLSSLIYCLLLGANGWQYLIYCVGSMAVMLNLVWLKLIDYKKIEKNLWLALAFFLTAAVLLESGRAALSALTGVASFFSAFVSFIFSDSLNLLIGFVIITVAFKQKGMFEYQPDYLVRMAEEYEKNKK